MQNHVASRKRSLIQNDSFLLYVRKFCTLTKSTVFFYKILVKCATQENFAVKSVILTSILICHIKLLGAIATLNIFYLLNMIFYYHDFFD